MLAIVLQSAVLVIVIQCNSSIFNVGSMNDIIQSTEYELLRKHTQEDPIKLDKDPI